jgi:hypothetical protein
MPPRQERVVKEKEKSRINTVTKVLRRFINTDFIKYQAEKEYF